MLSIDGIKNLYLLKYYQGIKNAKSFDDDCANCNAKERETYTTWKIDEEGDIVYYTIDKKTGEIISQTKYKNPGRIF